MNRREMVKMLGAMGCSAAAWPSMTSLALASTPGEGRLVTIVLRGAMDGLDVLRPVGDPVFKSLRPDAIDGIDLDGFYALHPALSGLMPLWQSGELGFAHAVSTPYRDERSHFDGQDILEAGSGRDLPPASQRDGWLNRVLQTMPGASSQTAFAVGRERPLILSGPAAFSQWMPETSLQLGPAAQSLLMRAYESDPLFAGAAQEALVLSQGGVETNREFPERNLARFAAQRLRDDTRIASFSISGWDTHRRQTQLMPGLLGRLSDTILTMKQELGPTWDKTAVIAMTEFGRTARFNGSGGSDHGTGGAMIMAGGAIRGRQVFARWPGLDEASLLDRRDLMPTMDVRQVAGEVIEGVLGFERRVVENIVFPGMESVSLGLLR